VVELRRTAAFHRWLKGLKDVKAKTKVLVRLDRLALGNAGDVAPVGDGVSEMRIHYGPGYRVYFKGQTLLIGGHKGSQAADIRKAKALARELQE
jgi:putative addiction module killer protein